MRALKASLIAGSIVALVAVQPALSQDGASVGVLLDSTDRDVPEDEVGEHPESGSGKEVKGSHNIAIRKGSAGGL